ncbi:MAG: rhomboid family intramembrane serine protease [Aestuariivirga sp.]
MSAPTPGNFERSAGPIFNVPWAVGALALVLILIHGILWFAGEEWQTWAILTLAFLPARYGGTPVPTLPGSEVWSFVTYALLHGSWQHLLFNLIWLVIFGTIVARQLGVAKFCLLAAISAAGGAAGTLAAYWGNMGIMVGASGAVSGLLGAAMPIMYGKPAGEGREPLHFVELIRDGRALAFTAVWLGLTLFSGATGWTGNSFADDFRIAWEAHLGGFVAGLAAFYLLYRRKPFQAANS